MTAVRREEQPAMGSTRAEARRTWLPRRGTVEVTVDASPEQVWAVISDVTRIGEWSHEAQSNVWLDGAVAAAPGVRFRGQNRQGRSRWSRTCEVVRVDDGLAIAWRTVPSRLYRDSSLWTYELEPAGAGTLIRQRFEILQIAPFFDWLYYRVVPAHRDRSAALEGDVRRLGEAAARG
jgi:uncharacterized protein YndB with AHSA1/START domain